LEVDEQLELDRLLDREVTRLGPLDDLVHEGGRATEVVGHVHSIGHQAPDLDRLAKGEHAWQPSPGREIHDESSTGERRGTRRDEERLDPGATDQREGLVELLGRVLGQYQRHTQGLRRRQKALPRGALPVFVFLAAEIGDATESLEPSLGRPALEDEVLPFHVAEGPQALHEPSSGDVDGLGSRHLRDRRRGENEADAVDLPCLLRFGGERRKKEADSENDREPDRSTPLTRDESQFVVRVTTILVASKAPVHGEPIHIRIAPNWRALVEEAGTYVGGRRARGPRAGDDDVRGRSRCTYF